ncbi:MAG: hypothetical protein ACRDTG_02170 [Pseudonocardiaceae bacterium]
MIAAVDDPALPEFARLTDRRGLARLLNGLDWLLEPDGVRAALRLRWKPGRSLRIGAVVPTALGAAAVLVAAFGPGSRSKADKLAEWSALRGAPVHRTGDIVAIPAGADPTLDGLIPSGVPLGYNPVRRWVGWCAGQAVKVHAVAPPPGVAALLTDPSRLLTRHLPAAEVAHNSRVVRTAWLPGTSPTAAELPIVREALTTLHSCPPPAGLPVLDADTVLHAAQAATQSVAATLPLERVRLATLLAALRRACGSGRWPAPTSLVHGDFSADQVVVVPGGRAMLLDLDRAAVGPPGWDAAHWVVAQLAVDAPVLPAPTAPSPILVLAAALLRAPEPFRRLRPAWPQLTRAVLDAAAESAREAAS